MYHIFINIYPRSLNPVIPAKFQEFTPATADIYDIVQSLEVVNIFLLANFDFLPRSPVCFFKIKIFIISQTAALFLNIKGNILPVQLIQKALGFTPE